MATKHLIFCYILVWMGDTQLNDLCAMSDILHLLNFLSQTELSVFALHNVSKRFNSFYQQCHNKKTEIIRTDMNSTLMLFRSVPIMRWFIIPHILMAIVTKYSVKIVWKLLKFVITNVRYLKKKNSKLRLEDYSIK